MLACRGIVVFYETIRQWCEGYTLICQILKKETWCIERLMVS